MTVCSLTAVLIFPGTFITPAGFSFSKQGLFRNSLLLSLTSQLANILAYKGRPGAVWGWANHLRLGFDPLTQAIEKLPARLV